MKRSGVAALAVLGGCNAILGLHETHQQDALVLETTEAGIDGAEKFAGRISVLLNDNMPDGTSAIDSMTPPSGDLHVQIGLQSDADLHDVGPDYADGLVAVPLGYAGQDWRLRVTYPIPFGTPTVHEYQWRQGAGFHVVAPVQYGHAPVAPLPGSGTVAYAITPTPSHTFTRPEFFTSGVWVDYRNPGNSTTFNFDWRAAGSQMLDHLGEPLVGPFGMPDKTKGDWQWLLDRHVDGGTGCVVAFGGAFLQQDLMTGTPTTTNTPFDTATNRVYPPVTFNASVKQRFNAVPHDDPVPNDSAWFYELSAFGWLPKDGIPGFVRRHALEQAQADLTTDRPLMLTMSECPIALTQQQTLLDNATVAAFMTRGNYLQLTAKRTIQVGAGPMIPIYSQISAVSRTDTVTASAPVAKSVMIEGLPLSDSGPEFSQTITTATRRTVDVTWTAETGSGIVAADEWEVTLIPIPGNQPWRVYHVNAPLVHIDTADLTTGVPNGAKNFLVKIVSHVGVPEAKTGNYTKVEYPYAATTTIPYGFKIP